MDLTFYSSKLFCYSVLNKISIIMVVVVFNLISFRLFEASCCVYLICMAKVVWAFCWSCTQGSDNLFFLTSLMTLGSVVWHSPKFNKYFNSFFKNYELKLHFWPSVFGILDPYNVNRFQECLKILKACLPCISSIWTF
jgi:hypothetical protein